MGGYTEDAGDLDEYMYDVDIARRVEQDKLNAIHMAAEDLKKKLATTSGRCNICTLRPPCKHIKVALPEPPILSDRQSRMSRAASRKLSRDNMSRRESSLVPPVMQGQIQAQINIAGD